VGMSPFKKTEDGFQYIWQANHLGHFLLTNLLMENLKSGTPSRVVVVSSGVHRYEDIHWDDISGEGTWYNDGWMIGWKAYCQSKTANILFAKKLNQLLKGFGVAFSLHPGFILTELNRDADNPLVLKLISFAALLSGKTASQGASTQVYAATAPELDTAGGVYLNLNRSINVTNSQQNPN